MNVKEFEEAVWKKETLRIIVRAPTWAKVDDYKNANAFDKRANITSFLKNRIRARIGDYEVAVIDGSGKVAHGGTIVQKVRDSYAT